MLRILHESVTEEDACSYLPGERARMRYRFLDDCDAETYSRLLERGWRRFGRLFFRPACAACGECRSLRLEVEHFAPGRSMRRTWRHNRDLRVVLRPATMSEEHLELYERYHADKAERQGWSEKSITPIEYHRTFVDGRRDFGHELLYLEGERLLGVALVDVLPRALSAVYCFYEPEERRRGLGTYSILRQVALARTLGASHLYLGYWVEGNASMRYKARFRPHEILSGRPESEEYPQWKPGDEVLS